MRATSLLNTLLALKQVRVVSVGYEDNAVVVDIKPTYRIPRCSECGISVPAIYDQSQTSRYWRHLDLAGIMVRIRYSMRRVNCPACGVKVEAVPWAASGSRFTLPFEQHVAYLTRKTDKSTVTGIMRISWRAVGSIVQRVVRRHRDQAGDPLDGLRIIGIDELSYRKHHSYVTVVIDHERGEVVWASEGKSAETLAGFFRELGAERTAKLEAVTIDMSKAFIKAVTEASPQALLIFDRFHVQRLAHDALDEVRRAEVNKVPVDEKRKLKRTRWALQKNPWNLNALEKEKLERLPEINRPIYDAYLMKETLLAILDRRQINVATTKLDEWIAWARGSGLAPFAKLANTIERHRDGILAYIRTRLNNGRVEALNGKTRVLTRRAYGFHSAASLIAMIFLCCSAIPLTPAHIAPFGTH